MNIACKCNNCDNNDGQGSCMFGVSDELIKNAYDKNVVMCKLLRYKIFKFTQFNSKELSEVTEVVNYLVESLNELVTDLEYKVDMLYAGDSYQQGKGTAYEYCLCKIKNILK